MPNLTATRNIVKHLKKHGDVAEQELEELLLSGSLKRSDLDISTAIEHDFGPDWRRKIDQMSPEAMEAIITAGTFNKMVQVVIRTSLREEPKEQYKMLNAVPMETKGECEGTFKDFGAFSDIQFKELCELEAAPLYGIATDWLGHPQGKASGAGIAWTREALCRDPNGFLAAEVSKLRDAADEWKENKILDTFIGYIPTYNRTGTLYDTYYESGAVTPFDNAGPWVNASDLYFSCPDDLDTVKDLFWDMTDMVHGREIMMDTDNLQLVTSKQQANRIRPLLLAQQIETNDTCNGTDTKWIMSAEVANGIVFDITSYSRFVDRIVLRYGVTQAAARNWWWVGQISQFIAWVTQVAPEVSRCPLGAEECRKRIVAIYNGYQKGYAYIRDPHKGVMLTGTAGSASA